MSLISNPRTRYPSLRFLLFKQFSVFWQLEPTVPKILCAMDLCRLSLPSAGQCKQHCLCDLSNNYISGLLFPRHAGKSVVFVAGPLPPLCVCVCVLGEVSYFCHQTSTLFGQLRTYAFAEQCRHCSI